jgi:tetratricopeptide (TPR) repeat protein
MNIKTEVAVFALFAAWAGWKASGLNADEVAPNRGRRGGGAQVYESVPSADLARALPPMGRDSWFSRDLFAPPSDTAPLPPLTLVLPPMEALSALAPPTAYGPGPKGLHLLRRSADVRPVPGLFAGSDEVAGAAAVDEFDPINPVDMSPEQRAARLEAFKRLYDWVVVQGRLRFGQIRNKERFDLARLNEQVLFVEIDPDTSLEVYPGQDPFKYERDMVSDFGLANTPANFIELRLREFEFPIRHGDYNDALEFAGRCVELRNDSPRALDVAKQMYKAAAEANPTEVAPQLGLARCYEVGFEFEAALGLYREITAGRFKTEAAPWARLGDLLADFRLFEPAEEAYREALRARSSNWEARWRYGRFLLGRGRAAEALDHLREASRREPDSRTARVDIRSTLGACFLHLGQVQEAYDTFSKARNADPDDDRGLAGMFSAALFLGEELQPDLTEAAQSAPDASFDLLLAFGLQAIDQELWPSARLYLERATQADPFRAWMAWRALSWLAEITGNPEEAYSFIERAYLSQPTDPWTLYQLGRLLSQQDDPLGATAAFRAALDRDLDFVDALIGLGRLQQLAGEYESAERYYERALSVDGARPVVHSLRGFNHFQLGEPDAAGKDFERALVEARRQGISLASAANGQAWSFYASGDSREARTRFAQLLDERRNEPEGDLHRAYADEQAKRIVDHESKEVWTDRFDRVATLGNAWSLDESDGIISVLRDGELWLEGQLDRSGQGRVYQTLPAERFLSIEATITIHESVQATVGLFVARENVGSSGEVRTVARVALRRNGAGAVQAAFTRKGQHEAEVMDLPEQRWAVGEPMQVRIERRGEAGDTRVTLWLDGLPVLDDIEVQSLGRSQSPVRFGVFVQGDANRSAKIAIDNVNVVRRK